VDDGLNACIQPDQTSPSTVTNLLEFAASPLEQD
jgi:hypothetical protein